MFYMFLFTQLFVFPCRTLFKLSKLGNGVCFYSFVCFFPDRLVVLLNGVDAKHRK